jgi:hypothetical protein
MSKQNSEREANSVNTYFGKNQDYISRISVEDIIKINWNRRKPRM